MKKILLVILPLAFLWSCGNVVSQYTAMKDMQDAIGKQFHLSDVSINITNGKYVQVSVINSTYNDSSNAAKQTLTDSIGKVCLQYFHPIDSATGRVLFVRKNSNLIVTTSDTHSYRMHF